MPTCFRILYFLLFLYTLPPGLMAQSRQSVRVAGLHNRVEVLRDQWGVNHIYASDQHDLFFAQGYLAARDRLFQFEIWRRQATGTVAELLGPRELARDAATRLFTFRGDLREEMRHYHPQGDQIIPAYVDGVNAYITEALKTPARLPAEFGLLHILPGKWTPQVVLSRHQGLLGNVTEELNIGRAVAAVGEQKVRELMWFHPKDPLLTLDSFITAGMLQADILAPYNAFHSDVVFRPGDISGKDIDQDAVLNRLNSLVAPGELYADKDQEGSNNWVVSGGRTLSGHTMLANDPHRKIAVPSLRYMVHLVAPGWNVIGAGEPEIPGVSIGHNQQGAWGLTIYETDGEDLFVYDLDSADLHRYRYQGRWVEMNQITESFHVKNARDTSVTLRYTVHGPVTYIDTARRKAYAVGCAWLKPGGAPYLASLRIDQAKDWASFRQACSYSHVPGENMVWADKSGNIGWKVVGLIPRRNHFSGLVPVPGDGRYEWDDFVPIDNRPAVFNPPAGYFSTANQDVTPPDFGEWQSVGYTWADPFRGDRIREVLAANNHMTIADMEALQTDYLSLPARTLVPLLRGITFSDSLTSYARYRLLSWNDVMDKESVPAAIYALWERQLMQDARQRFVPASVRPWIDLQLTRVIEFLEHPLDHFGGDGTSARDAFVKESFERAVLALRAKLGDNPARWQYGQPAFKHVTIEHPLHAVVPPAWQQKLRVGPLPRGGNAYTPGSTGSSDNQLSGASFRFITDTGDWDQAVMINTPGQSGDPESPYYRNLFSRWAADRYFPAYYSREKIIRSTASVLQLVPAK